MQDCNCACLKTILQPEKNNNQDKKLKEAFYKSTHRTTRVTVLVNELLYIKTTPRLNMRRQTRIKKELAKNMNKIKSCILQKCRQTFSRSAVLLHLFFNLLQQYFRKVHDCCICISRKQICGKLCGCFFALVLFLRNCNIYIQCLMPSMQIYLVVYNCNINL